MDLLSINAMTYRVNRKGGYSIMLYYNQRLYSHVLILSRAETLLLTVVTRGAGDDQGKIYQHK